MLSASLVIPPQAAAAASMMLSIRRMLHVPCSAVNAPCDSIFHTPWMETPFERVIAEIARRHPKQRGREETWLAEQLKLEVQVVHNWKSRGIPARRLGDVGAVLGWTRDVVAGDAEPVDPWPFELVPFERFDKLSERQKGIVEQAMLEAMEKAEAAARPFATPDKQPAAA